MTTMLQSTYPDEHIEKWAEVFLANPGLLRRGILFLTFLAAPEPILMAHMNTLAPNSLDPLPLLPRQRQAAAGIYIGQIDNGCPYRIAFEDLEMP